MMQYTEENDQALDQDGSSDGENTMAVLSTLGGGDNVLPEGEALGLDTESGKAKLSGSSLAVGVVVVLGAVTVFGMKMTLSAIGIDTDPSSAIAEIDGFIAAHNAATQSDKDGPLSTTDQESQQVLDELQQDPTKHQVPAEQVEVNPFDLGNLLGTKTTEGVQKTPTDRDRIRAIEKAKGVASKLKVDMISGQIAYIDGEMYRVGDKIAESGFKLEKIEGLTCIIRTTDEFKLPFRLRYR